MKTLRLTLAYDGTTFSGFQIQNNGRTVQGELETALTSLTGESIRVTGAGRTDAGVHARGQSVSFTTLSALPASTFVKALNAMLPRDVCVLDAEEAPADFHARFWATGKVYTYDIWNTPVRPVFERNTVWHVPRPLDIAAMQAGGHHLEGRHDFSAFKAAGGSTRTSVREVSHLTVRQEGPQVRISVAADGFLYHMVRIIAGTLVEIGTGKYAPEKMPAILSSACRAEAGPTAPAIGLCLQEVFYDRSGDGLIMPAHRPVREEPGNNHRFTS